METLKNHARALRRHHRARLKKNRRYYWGREGLADWTPCSLGKAIDTPHPCSCLGCGNSRRWLGERTIQERRAYQVPLLEE